MLIRVYEAGMSALTQLGGRVVDLLMCLYGAEEFAVRPEVFQLAVEAPLAGSLKQASPR